MFQSTAIKRLGFSKLVLYALATLAFFEPLLIYEMKKAQLFGSIPQIADHCFDIASFIVSCTVLIVIFRDETIIDAHRWSLVFAACVIIIVTSLLNDSLYVACSSVFHCVTLIGLLLLLLWLYEHYSFLVLLEVLIVAFSVQLLLSFVLFLPFPTGIISSNDVTARVYYFGGKNSLFVFSLPLVTALAVRDCLVSKKVTKWTVLLVLALALTAVLLHSANSSICFVLLAGLLLLQASCVYPSKLLCLPVLLVFVGIAFIFIIGADEFNFAESFLAKFGRNTTFSGRDVLWQQALELISMHPLLGNGANVAYVLSDGVVTGHPHSAYLEYAVQHGLILMAILIVDSGLLAIRSAEVNCISSCVNAASVCYFVLLFHSLIDSVSLPTFVLLRVLVELTILQTGRSADKRLQSCLKK